MEDPKELELVIKDFRYFLIYTWKHLKLPHPTRTQLHIAEYLQEPYQLSQLQAFRGIGKTWITGAYILWRLFKDPDEKILLVSETSTFATNITTFIKNLIDTLPIAKHLKKKTKGRYATAMFDVEGASTSVQPSVRAIGIGGQLQGNRATLIIGDDVEGIENTNSAQKREEMKRRISEFIAIVQTQKEDGLPIKVVMLGTPQHSDSIYNFLQTVGFTTRIFPARYPENLDEYKGCLAPYLLEDMANDPNLVGTPIDSRFPEEVLLTKAQTMGASNFKLQFMMSTALTDIDKFPLKVQDMTITDLGLLDCPEKISYSSDKNNVIEDIPNPSHLNDHYMRGIIGGSYVPYEGSVLAIDPSGRGKDEMGWAVVNHLYGKIMVPAFGGLVGGYALENLVALSQIAKKYQVNSIIIESNFGGGMFNNLLAPVLNDIYPCSIEEVRNNKQKELRIIDTLEPLFNQHRIVMDISAIKKDVAIYADDSLKIHKSLIHQLSHITKERGCLVHDDRLDALAIGVQYWNERDILLQDPLKALDEGVNFYKRSSMKNICDAIVESHFQTTDIGISPAYSRLNSYKDFI